MIRISFNSLQTGKPIQRRAGTDETHYDYGFNSLQTGKPIQSPHLNSLPKMLVVSIPFKRESLSKVDYSASLMFISTSLVSIPFKRESLSKVVKRGT